MEDRIKKLPQWAQSHIDDLKRQVHRLKEDLAQAKGEIGETDIFIDMGYQRDIPVDPEASIKIGQFDIRKCDNETLRITDGYHRGHTAVIPQCGNVVLIKSIERN